MTKVHISSMMMYLVGEIIREYQYGITKEIKQKIEDKGKSFFMVSDKSKFINNPDNE